MAAKTNSERATHEQVATERELFELRQLVEELRAAEARTASNKLHSAAQHAVAWHDASDPPRDAVGYDVLHTVLDCIAAGVMQISAEGSVLYANPLARQILSYVGFDPVQGSLQALGQLTVWPDGTPCRVQDFPSVKCLQTGERQPPTTIGLRLPNQEIMWLTITSVPLLDPATGRAASAIATLVDVSYPKYMEDSWRASEDRYRRLVDNAPDAIVVHRDFKIVFINNAGVQMWGGRSPEQFIGRDILSFVHPRYRRSARRRIAKAAAGGVPPLIDHLNVRLDGRVIHVEVTGTPCVYEGQPSVQAILRDVTEKKRAERQVRRQREILKKFFNRIPLLVALFGRDGRITIANRQWKQMLGWRTGLSISQSFASCFADSDALGQVVEHIQASPAVWRDFQCRLVDGRLLDIAWAAISLSDGTRIAIGQDVTERKAAEEVLRRGNAELERLVRARTEELSTKNEQLQSEVLERRKAESQLQDKQSFLEKMLGAHEAHRRLVAYEIHDTFLQDVIAALMYVDGHDGERRRGDQPNPESLDLARRLLRKSIDEARRLISGLRPPIIDEQGVVAGIQYLINESKARGVEIEFTHSMPEERLEPQLEATLFRIVQEAITNLERHSLSRYGQIELTQHEQNLRLVVRDFGAGFDPAEIGQGHFGLQGMQERVRYVGGSLSIRSAPGAGTEIVVDIPPKAPESDTLAAPPAREQDGAK